ncbi:MAG: DUF1934 domain-containing protein [Candidatus Cellulosilyticum pullistercoris]|uniref:DUF1934 domain-containing protein n=1 Tax=Candidatus Cellulosilyticum pullistercoris TaxID=2838521 RepID=A0A9E2KDA2_9FIRM|nr:DUF1934 domain-containing protein [Candidatus Cellulosilyticum pullistercoris]
MKEVQVKVFDKQIYPTHSDEAENTFSGNLAIKGEDIFITYKDKSTGVNTIIKASKEGISVTRMGAMNGKLKFEVDKPYKTSYGTPYGEMPIEIQTSKTDVYLLEKGIKIYIEYKILMNDEKVSDNLFMIVAN